MVFCNEDMLDRFPQAEVVFLGRYNSNHVPVLLCLEGATEVSNRKRNKPFRFEVMWFANDDSMDVIRNGWQNPGPYSAKPGILGKVN